MGNTMHAFSDNKLNDIDIKLLYVSTSKYEDDWHSQLHTHHFMELFYIMNGRGSFLIEEEQLPVRRNDLVIINPNVSHTELPETGIPLEYIVLGVEGVTFSFQGANAGKDYDIHHLEQDGEKIEHFLMLLIEEAEGKLQSYEMICQNILELLILYAMRNQNSSITSVMTPKMSKECGLIKRYLDTNYDQNITLDSLAEMSHINKFYLVHSFTRYTGMSPIHYLARKRVLVAKNLLEASNHSIAQIASSIGCSSQSYFSQIFKKETGMTPNQYRKKMREHYAAGARN